MTWRIHRQTRGIPLAFYRGLAAKDRDGCLTAALRDRTVRRTRAHETLGLHATVLDALADLDLLVLSAFALGCVVGLAAFSTLLHWALARFHDAVMAVLIGLMIGSARVLLPWPADQGIGSPQIGRPDGDAVTLSLALGFAAFALVWIFGLVSSGSERRGVRRIADGPDAAEN